MTCHWGIIAQNCPKTSCKRCWFLIQNSWKNTCLNESALRGPAVETTVPLEVLENIVENCLRTGKETNSGLIFRSGVSVPTGVQIWGWTKTWMWSYSHNREVTKTYKHDYFLKHSGFGAFLIWKISLGNGHLTKGGTRKHSNSRKSNQWQKECDFRDMTQINYAIIKLHWFI